MASPYMRWRKTDGLATKMCIPLQRTFPASAPPTLPCLFPAPLRFASFSSLAGQEACRETDANEKFIRNCKPSKVLMTICGR